MTERSDHPAVLVLPPLIFLGYLLGALAVNWALPIATPWPGVLRVVGGLAVAAGIFLAFSSVSQMMKAHTTPDPHKPTTALVTGGPYRFTRNPIYLGFLLAYLGFTLWVGTLWGVLLSPFLIAAVIRSVIKPEEIYLEGKFPDEYNQYKSRARRWL